MNERFTELAPWYVNGTISASDRAWVDGYLDAHPEARAELRWYESVQRRVRENEPDVSDEIGLERAMGMIRRDQAGEQRIAAARAAQQPGFMQRLRGWLGGGALRPALGAALAVIAIQGVVIFTMYGQSEGRYTDMRSAAPAAGAPMATIRINFRPDTKEADLRMLLIEVQGTLVGGPGQLGDYFIAVPKDRGTEIEATLRRSPIVEGATIVPGLPHRD